MREGIEWFHIQDEIGSGEFGAVYRAWEEWDNYEAVIKALNERGFPDAEAAERFRRDADALSDIDHPNIAGVHKYGESGDFRYVVMDIMSGSLRETLDSGGKMSLSRAVDICRQAALGLKAAHDVGVIHRDVNPKNIMFDSDGVVKVSDFGLERADYQPAIALDGAPMAGGRIYASPEQMSGGRADARSDIYSLGAVLYEALAGRTPVWGESLALLRPNAPAALRTAVGKCLEPNPENRYQTMDELLQALSPALVNRCALVDFYEAAGGPNWRRSDNWLTDKPLDEWSGVTADGDGLVTAIELGIEITRRKPFEASANNLKGGIPREIAYLTKLERLHLSGNRIESVPPEIGGLANLKSLYLSDNEIESVPPELGGLANLERLHLGYNGIKIGGDGLKSVPPEIGALANLKLLDLSDNRLESVPPELGGLANLLWLHLSGNELESVPPELGGLANLKLLDLRHNRLGSVPPELGGLTNLKTLSLEYNRLGSLPPELGGLTNLKTLSLGGNNWAGGVPKALFDVPCNDLGEIDFPVCGSASPPAAFRPPARGAPPVSLREILADGRLSLYRSVDVFRQIALELSASRERGVIHGHVKPENILIDSAGAAKMADGLRTAADAKTAVASPRYWSPEQWKGERADVRSSVYSLGITLHEMLTGSGEAPFGAAGEAPLKRIRPGVPTGLARIVEKALELDPRRRFRTMDELVESVSLDLVNRCALTDLYEALDGDNWSRKCNWLTDKPLDRWHGVTANRDGVVTGLSLGGGVFANIKGELPSEIASLTGLKSLELNSYDLRGSIPPEIGELTELERLVISGCQISGSIPPELGSLTKLKYLDLSDNQDLSGSIPPELGGLTELKYLNFGGVFNSNGLSGNIPPELGNLAKLKSLRLNGNCLSGSVPPELGGLAKLRELDLSYNGGLTGSVPPELGGLAKLKELNFAYNCLSGNIPPELGGLAKLKTLKLGFNRLSGSVPPELGGLAKLKELTLNGNRLSGNIPPELGRLAKLRDLNFFHNRLSGNIPPELGGLAKLEELYLSGNLLSGSVPPEIGGLTELISLNLSENFLSGSVPPELGGLADLDKVDLSHNLLSGNIPPELGGLADLDKVDLSHNLLSGNIPPELGGLTNLSWLDLSHNRLSGSLLPEICGLGSASQMSLNIYFGFNRLSGSVPPEIGGMTELYFLDLRGNRLSGSVPPEIGRMANLKHLDLRGNRLSGSAPRELCGLNLYSVFLSGNDWTGCIPKALFDVDENDLDEIDLPVCDG